MAAVLGFLSRQDEDLPDTVLLIWPECRVPKGSASELPLACYAWRLLDRVEFGRAHWFSIQEEEARSSAICFHQEILSSMVMSKAENVRKAEIEGLVMVIVAYAIEEFAWSFEICSSGM